MAKILIVEDVPEMVDLLLYILQADGHTVKVAGDGLMAMQLMGMEVEEAVPFDQQFIPDLLVLDVMMPKVDGYTLLSRMQQFEHTCKIPTVIITVKTSLRETLQSIPNVVDFFSKPIDSQSFRKRVREILSSKK